MRILIATDAWQPQVNGVVTALVNTIAWLRRWGHEVHVVSPEGFRTVPMPTYPEIPLALFPRREVARRIRDFDPDTIHIATEGPIGGAALAALTLDRSRCRRYAERFPWQESSGQFLSHLVTAAPVTSSVILRT